MAGDKVPSKATLNMPSLFSKLTTTPAEEEGKERAGDKVPSGATLSAATVPYLADYKVCTGERERRGQKRRADAEGWVMTQHQHFEHATTVLEAADKAWKKAGMCIATGVLVSPACMPFSYATTSLTHPNFCCSVLRIEHKDK